MIEIADITPDEEWRDIPNLEGAYQASSLGRIRRNLPGRNTYVGRIRKQVMYPNGYYHVSLWIDGRRRIHAVHRLVASAFFPNDDHSLFVLHGDGSRTNNRPENLRWGTHQENVADTIIHGTRRCGENHHNAKLSQQQVKEIRGSTETQRVVAARYGVSQSLISQIKAGGAW